MVRTKHLALFALLALLLGLALALPTAALAATPARVTGLAITKVTTTTATLSWNPASRALRYYVYRRELGKPASWVYLGYTSASRRTFTSKSLSVRSNYQFRVRAKATYYGSYSSSVTDYLRRPRAVEFEEGSPEGSYVNGSLFAKWTASSSAVAYRVQYQMQGLDPADPASRLSSVMEAGAVESTIVTDLSRTVYEVTNYGDNRDLWCWVTPISRFGVYGDRALLTCGPNDIINMSEYRLGLPKADEPSTTVHALSSTDVGTLEIVAESSDDSRFEIEGMPSDHAAVFAAAETSPSAPVIVGLQSRHHADGSTYVFATFVSIYPSGRIVPMQIHLVRARDGLESLDTTTGVFTFADATLGRVYGAVLYKGAAISLNGSAATRSNFFSWFNNGEMEAGFFTLSRLDTPIEIDGVLVDYEVTSASNTPPNR